jgi:hypothetical protein
VSGWGGGSILDAAEFASGATGGYLDLGTAEPAPGQGASTQLDAGYGIATKAGGTLTLLGGAGDGGGSDPARIDVGGGTSTYAGVITLTGLVITDLPTSDPAVLGALYSLAGVVKVSAG